MEIELEIQSDGSFLIPRGTKKHNDILREIFNGETVDDEGLSSFLSATDDVDLIVGETTMCG